MDPYQCVVACVAIVSIAGFLSWLFYLAAKY
jgi:hypothetical protein